MVSESFRLLEMVFLLIPVVAILLQTMVSFYSSHGLNAPGWKMGAAFTAVLFGLVFFGVAGTQLILFMAQNQVNTSLINASVATLVGLAAVAVGVIITITDVFSVSQTGSQEGIPRQSSRAGLVEEEQGNHQDQQQEVEQDGT